ncbi:hypothetical protein [Halalkalibaculum sp. DA3122]|uniref:hypothetical protein n=1 Tax=Halalkalibaculum sp. DA3122 TaxID=3373607 RepID=UPI003754314B
MCIFLLIMFLLIGCGRSEKQESSATIEVSQTDTLVAVQDFERLEVEGYVPAYRDESRGVIAVNSIEYPDEFGAVETIWRGESGVYNVTIETMPEEDGESTYRLFINSEFKAEFVNPETDQPFGNASHTWDKIEINSGDTLRIASNTHSNGLIPEGDGFAWARGRWSKLIFEPITK